MQGKLIIFSAPSGAGKTTIVRHLLKQDLGLEFSVSACSRPKREGEEHGRDYYFLKGQEFKKKIEEGEFIEWEEVYDGNFYGTLQSEIDRIWAKGKSVIFDVDVTGGLNLKKKFGEKALAIFVMPPSVGHLETRLKTRQTDTAESISQRIAKAENELKTALEFDVILVNDDLQNALEEAEELVKEFLVGC